MDVAMTTPARNLDVVGLVRTVGSGVVQGQRHADASSPVVLARFVLVGMTVLVRVVRGVLHLGWRRDLVRLFTRTARPCSWPMPDTAARSTPCWPVKCRAVARQAEARVGPVRLSAPPARAAPLRVLSARCPVDRHHPAASHPARRVADVV